MIDIFDILEPVGRAALGIATTIVNLGHLEASGGRYRLFFIGSIVFESAVCHLNKKQLCLRQ